MFLSAALGAQEAADDIFNTVVSIVEYRKICKPTDVVDLLKNLHRGDASALKVVVGSHGSIMTFVFIW